MFIYVQHGFIQRIKHIHHYSLHIKPNQRTFQKLNGTFLPFLRPKSTGRSNTLKTNRRGRDFKNVRQFNVAFSGWWEKGKKKVAVFEKK